MTKKMSKRPPGAKIAQETLYAIELYRAGHTVEQAAEVSGVSPSTLYYHLEGELRKNPLDKRTG